MEEENNEIQLHDDYLPIQDYEISELIISVKDGELPEEVIDTSPSNEDYKDTVLTFDKKRIEKAIEEDIDRVKYCFARMIKAETIANQEYWWFRSHHCHIIALKMARKVWVPMENNARYNRWLDKLESEGRRWKHLSCEAKYNPDIPEISYQETTESKDAREAIEEFAETLESDNLRYCFAWRLWTHDVDLPESLKEWEPILLAECMEVERNERPRRIRYKRKTVDGPSRKYLKESIFRTKYTSYGRKSYERMEKLRREFVKNRGAIFLYNLPI